MYEVELKLRADHEPVRERLADLQAESAGAVSQEDAYYDHPCRSFAESDEALRIRRERVGSDGGDRAVLTYKGPKVDDESKTRAEVESGVADPDAVDAVLRAVGFDPAAVVRKDRERFRLDGYTVTLDRVDGLGEFVEVEAEGESAEIDRLRAGAADLVDRLGLDPDRGIRASYLELLLDGNDR